MCKSYTYNIYGSFSFVILCRLPPCANNSFVQAWPGLARLGQAWPGLARPGQAWPGQAKPGLAGALCRGGGLCINLFDSIKIETAM